MLQQWLLLVLQMKLMQQLLQVLSQLQWEQELSLLLLWREQLPPAGWSLIPSESR